MRGDIRTTLDSLMDEDFSGHAWTQEELRTFKERLRKKLVPSRKPARGVFSPYQVISRARKALSDATVITPDVGAHKLLVAQIWKSKNPMTFFMSNGLSSIDFGARGVKLTSLGELPEVLSTGFNLDRPTVGNPAR